MSKQRQRVVFIDNPKPDGKRYTVQKCAAEYVTKGWAEWAGPDRIRFIERVQREVYFAKQFCGSESKANGSSNYWWNGCDTRPDAAHAPGESSTISKAHVRIAPETILIVPSNLPGPGRPVLPPLRAV